MIQISFKQENIYDLSGEFGIGTTTNGSTFYFDLEDCDRIRHHCWNVNSKGYVKSQQQKAVDLLNDESEG